MSSTQDLNAQNSGVSAITSGPLIIRTYNDQSGNNTFLVTKYDYPVSSNFLLTTSTGGQLVPSNDIFVSSLSVSTLQIKSAIFSTTIGLSETVSSIQIGNGTFSTMTGLNERVSSIQIGYGEFSSVYGLYENISSIDINAGSFYNMVGEGLTVTNVGMSNGTFSTMTGLLENVSSLNASTIYVTELTGSTISTNTLVVASTITVSTLTATNINAPGLSLTSFSTLTGSTLTASSVITQNLSTFTVSTNTLAVASTITVSTLNATNINAPGLSLTSFSTLTGSTLTASSLNSQILATSTLSIASTMISLGPSTNQIYTTLAAGRVSTIGSWISTLSSSVGTPLSSMRTLSMSGNGQYQLALSQVSTTTSVYLTSTSAQNWSAISGATGLPTATQTIYSTGAISGNGQYGALAVSGGYMYITSTFGSSWSNANPNTPDIYLPFETVPVNGTTTGGTTLTVTTGGNVPTTASSNVVGTAAIRFTNTPGSNPTQYIRGTWTTPGTSNFTWSFWFNAAQVNGNQQNIIVGFGGSTSVIINTSNALQFYAGSAFIPATSMYYISANVWYNVTAIFIAGSGSLSGTAYLYVNNVLIGSGPCGITAGTSTGFFTLAGNDLATPTSSFNGSIDDLKIYNYAITMTPMVPMNYNNVVISNTGQYMLTTATGSGIFASSNYGQTWFQVTSMMLTGTWVGLALSASGQYMLTYAATGTATPQLTGLSGAITGNTVTTWSNNGITWTSSASSSNNISPELQPWGAFNNSYSTNGPPSLGGTYSWASRNHYTAGVYNNSYVTYISGGVSLAIYGEWLQIQSSIPLVMNTYNFACGGFGGVPKTYYIVGSNDGANWYPLHYGSIAANPFASSGFAAGTNSPIIVNQSGSQTITGSNGGTSQTITCTIYPTTTNAYTYFRIIATSVFSASSFELAEWILSFNTGNYFYSTTYGSTWSNDQPQPTLTAPTALAISGNGQYALSINGTATVYLITNYVTQLDTAGYSTPTFTPTLVTSTNNPIAAAISNTGQYMVLVTNATTGANVYYSSNYGMTFIGILLGSIAMTSCAISYDGSYISVSNAASVYTLNNNGNGFSLAIGSQAGQTNQGQNAIAIGNQAGITNQSSNSIIVNATGSSLNSYYPGFFAAPVASYTNSSSALFNLLGYGTDNQIVQTGIVYGSGQTYQTVYGEWIQLQLATATSISSYGLQGRVGLLQRYPVAWYFVGSTDGITWIQLDYQSGNSGWYTYPLKSATAPYSYFRIIFTQVNSATTYVDIGGFNLYNNNGSIFGATSLYTVVQSGFYNILQLSSTTVCTVTFSWAVSTISNTLGISTTGPSSANPCGWLPTTNGAATQERFLGFVYAVPTTSTEYNTSFIAVRGTSTVIGTTTGPTLNIAYNLGVSGNSYFIGNVGIGTTLATQAPAVAFSVYGNTNLGGGATSVTTIAGTLIQTSGQSGGPFSYQSQWDTASTASRVVGWIAKLNGYNGGPFSNGSTLFLNMIGILTIYIRNTALTGYYIVQYYVSHPQAAPTTGSVSSAAGAMGTPFAPGVNLFTTTSFNGSSGEIDIITNNGGTSPSIQVCWTITAAT